MIGSHLDSVDSGGAFDGPLGVVSSFAAIDALRDKGFRASAADRRRRVRRGRRIAVRERLSGLSTGHRPA
ncbi:MAG: hypothetical protein WKF82_13825 [Nocardioidaceae bacterium]